MSACRAETIFSQQNSCCRIDVEEEVLRRIKPSPHEYLVVGSAVNKVVELLEKAKSFLDIDYTVSVQGSFAKDT